MCRSSRQRCLAGAASAVLVLLMSECLWYALQVRSRQESVVAGLLAHRGYEVFLPVYSSSRRMSDRVKIYETPLFPGYVFSRFALGERGRLIVTTPGVAHIVKFGGRPAALHQDEINAIRTIVRSGLPALTCDLIEPGAKVFIESGPLAGIEGILLQRKSESQLVVSIPLLRRSLAVVVDTSWIASKRVASAA
jgi:transcription termination/antitermination protein NusG